MNWTLLRLVPIIKPILAWGPMLATWPINFRENVWDVDWSCGQYRSTSNIGSWQERVLRILYYLILRAFPDPGATTAQLTQTRVRIVTTCTDATDPTKWTCAHTSHEAYYKGSVNPDQQLRVALTPLAVRGLVLGAHLEVRNFWLWGSRLQARTQSGCSNTVKFAAASMPRMCALKDNASMVCFAKQSQASSFSA